MKKLVLIVLVVLAVAAAVLYFLLGGNDPERRAALKEERESLRACKELIKSGFRPVAETRDERFLGKVAEFTARCRGGDRAVLYRDVPWVDWANYWGTGDASSLAPDFLERLKLTNRLIDKLGLRDGFNHLTPNGRGVDGALIDLEYERIELIKFNLFDNSTYEDYVTGRDGVGGPALKVWPEMRLPADHPSYEAVGGDGEQLCQGELIRHRTLDGICNDIKNPVMGSTNTLFARNVQFETTFPRLGRTEMVRNRHGDRLGLLEPDPQVISRRLFTRFQEDAAACREGFGLDGYSKEASCDYHKAPFFNVLAAFWIQFMTHDWFSHLVEGHNQAEYMEVGCSDEDAARYGCRPGDRMEKAYVADDSEPGTFSHGGREHLARAPRTFRNTNTAWWDASQLYGYDETSRRRVKRDPEDPARLLLEEGYLPLLQEGDPMNPAWAGQEATAFPDNWTIGMSFYHNLFAREHNAFVDHFRSRAAQTPDDDSGLRDPADPEAVITYAEVSDDELFEAARLVVAAVIAKIHTIEWTTQLLYDEPLYKAMNANWSGLFGDHPDVSEALSQVVRKLGESDDADAATQWYSVFASGPGILGTGSKVYEVDGEVRKDVWSLSNPDHVNGGLNHFGSPFNFPEEFVTVYRLHALVPDLLEYRDAQQDHDVILEKVPVVESFRGRATAMMQDRGLENWALTMGRQRLGLLTLNNHPQFLQNLKMERLTQGTGQIDVAALDLIRDRERGIPRFNEFRRQYGLQQLTSFDDFVDTRLPEGSAERKRQEEYVTILREVYGQHTCDASKVITEAQLNADGSPIDDCLGHPDGTLVDNVEDVDTVVGWLAEGPRPHGYAISETQFVVFILNASRRLFSDRFFTSSYRPEFYTHLGIAWVDDNGPDGKLMEEGEPNGHPQEVSPLKRVLLRALPELEDELDGVVNAFDPWARDRGEYYSLAWEPRPGAEGDEAFPQAAAGASDE